MDIEIYEGSNGEAYVDLSPPHRHPRRSTVAPTSPLVAKTVRMKKQHRPAPRPSSPEAEAAAIVAAGEDILIAHQAKHRRVAPTLSKLAAAARRLDQGMPDACHMQPKHSHPLRQVQSV
jgi:hypothetical protein